VAIGYAPMDREAARRDPAELARAALAIHRFFDEVSRELPIFEPIGSAADRSDAVSLSEDSRRALAIATGSRATEQAWRTLAECAGHGTGASDAGGCRNRVGDIGTVLWTRNGERRSMRPIAAIVTLPKRPDVPMRGSLGHADRALRPAGRSVTLCCTARPTSRISDTSARKGGRVAAAQPDRKPSDASHHRKHSTRCCR